MWYEISQGHTDNMICHLNFLSSHDEDMICHVMFFLFIVSKFFFSLAYTKITFLNNAAWYIWHNMKLSLRDICSWKSLCAIVVKIKGTSHNHLTTNKITLYTTSYRVTLYCLNIFSKKKTTESPFSYIMMITCCSVLESTGIMLYIYMYMFYSYYLV